MKEGMGKYTYPDGKMYEGRWVNGKRHGRGVFRDTNGEHMVGQWENGGFVSHVK